MLEILILVRLCKKLAAMAREKNRPGSWGALGAILWIGGEIGGAVLGVGVDADGMTPYVYALVGAILGTVSAYFIVKSLVPIPEDTGLPVARVIK